MSSRSGSEEKKAKRQPKKQEQAYQSEGEESEEYEPQPPPRRRRNQRQQQKSGGGPLDNLALDNVQNTAGGLVNSATGALGGVAGNAVQNQKGGDGGGKSDTLRLRLDLNLDIEITLKAKIHGDLELALLYVNFTSSPVSFFVFPLGRSVTFALLAPLSQASISPAKTPYCTVENTDAASVFRTSVVLIPPPPLPPHLHTYHQSSHAPFIPHITTLYPPPRVSFLVSRVVSYLG